MKKRKTAPSETNSGLNHILKYTGIFGLVQVLKMLMDIIRNKLSAKFLGPGGMGLLNIYSNATRLMSDSTNFGVAVSGVKHISEIQEEGNQEQLVEYACIVRSLSLLAGFFGMVLYLILSPSFSLWTFGSYENTWNYMLLTPIVCLLSMTGGEMAILKGTKQLMRITKISIYVALAMLAVFAPVLYFLERGGIIWALLLSHLVITFIYFFHSTKKIPYRVNLRSKALLKKGLPILRLGTGFIIAGLFSQGAEYLIRAIILQHGGEHDVGLYNSGYVIAVSYASIIFSAMDADYYPRLSGACKDTVRQNSIINKQIEALVLLISPFLIFFIIGMPVIIPILYTDEFTSCIPMSTFAMLYMFFRAFFIPVSYLALAHGDTKMFMMTELICAVMISLSIPFCYLHWGLTSTGMAISGCGLIEFSMIYLLYRQRYHFRFNTRHVTLYLIQFLLLALSIFIALTQTHWLRWCTGAALCAASLSMSLYVLSNESDVIERIRSKFSKKSHKER